MGTESSDVAIHYRLTAPSTPGSKHGVVIFTAKRLSISFMETGVTKWSATTGTDKMLWMPRLVQGCHTRLKKNEEVNILLETLETLPENR